MDKWERQDINNLDFKELCENFYYYKRKMGYGPAAIEGYDANVFICIFKDKEQLISNWKKINYIIAFRVQKRIDKIIEKSNFYICLFVNECIGSDNKSRIQGNSFCAKKYVFEEKLMHCMYILHQETWMKQISRSWKSIKKKTQIMYAV